MWWVAELCHYGRDEIEVAIKLCRTMKEQKLFWYSKAMCSQ